ncbi:MAG: putative membrane protein YedE/YeeE [Gammaproteobacteria bacterium]|jgi:uncharacterized membrane protein YedE/YeeE
MITVLLNHPRRRPHEPRRPQWALALGGTVAAVVLGGYAQTFSPIGALILMLAFAMGVTLYHAAFGFTGAYRRFIEDGDLSGISAQFIMLSIAMVLFAPTLDSGDVFGHGVSGALAPVSVSMAIGAFLFGAGMQTGGGCASGTLFSVGGGSTKMLLVLFFFCLGCFLATFHFNWWVSLPSAGTISLRNILGTWQALALQLGALALLTSTLWLFGARHRNSLWSRASEEQFRLTWRRLLHGPWPLLLGAAMLALLNWATLLVAGHPWSVTWAFTLWATKTAVFFGWDPASVSFWSGGFTRRSLYQPLLADTTSVMNFSIILGAFAAASLAGRFHPQWRMSLRDGVFAVLGGLMLGYGARLAYGCNIGALFSGIASTSLHGWVWLFAAMAGNVLALRVRRRPGPTPV